MAAKPIILSVLMMALGACAARAVEPSVGQGEPYALAGKRLVFTNWIYVRTGQLDWTNDKGESVFGKSVKDGPWDAHFHGIMVPHGVRLIAEPAQRLDKPLIARERPWESKGIGMGTLLRDGDKYRLWGFCQDADDVCRMCYFESEDGKNWRRPSLGVMSYKGSSDNNLVRDVYGRPWQYDPKAAPKPSNSVVHFSVFKDPNPNAPPEERYKSAREGDAENGYFENVWKKKYPWSVMALEPDPGRVHAILGAVSPDGIHWTDLKEPIAIEMSDTHIVIDFDQITHNYLLYTRSYMVAPRDPNIPNPTERSHAFVCRRAIGLGMSQDFHHFPPSNVIVESENDWLPTDTIYTNCKTTIPGAPDEHVMFPAVYHQADDTMSVMLYSSYDRKVWHKASNAPVLDTAAFGQFDGGCILAYPNLTELANGDWILPYTGFAYPHKYPRGAWSFDAAAAVWPKGRLAAIESPERGEFWTVGLTPPGRTIKINAVTERAGSITAEICDFDGKPIPARTIADAKPIIGDQFHTLLEWKDGSDISVAAGKPVILHFVMDHAKLFGLDFE
jgi:hypothetical protein